MGSSRHVVVIGLDGASPDLVERWTASGDLPVLRGLIEQGTFVPLASTIPPVSPTAWSTFMTGQNPAGHGVLGFRNLDCRLYEFWESDIVGSHLVSTKTFWDFAGQDGARVGVLWVPVTYPPWPVNGLLVSGYPTPSATRSFGFPEDKAGKLPGLTENSAFFNSAPPEEIAGELVRLARERGRLAAQLLRREKFDLFVVVIGSIDRAQHDFWHHFDPRSPAHDPAQARRFGRVIFETYRAADSAVGEILDAAPDGASVFVVSDHGGGPAARKVVHLNVWLRLKGYLVARRPGKARSVLARTYSHLKERIAAKERIFGRLPRALRRRLTRFDALAGSDLGLIDWSRTKAYRFPLYPPYEGIVINLARRQPSGCVAGDQYEGIREDIIAAIGELRDPANGEPVAARVFRREEIYSGEHLERFPDIIVELQPAYAGGSEIWAEAVGDVPRRRLVRPSGAHKMNGILISAGPDMACSSSATRARIEDIAPTVLYAMGLARPDTMDGRVLAELFDPGYLREHLVESAEAGQEPSTPAGGGIPPDEQAEIAENLRHLGYID